MPGPANAIMGDDNFGTELPEMEVDTKALDEVKNRAKFSRTAEFKKQKEYLESRIAYYQSYLPGNVPVEAITDVERGKYWAVANSVITEFNLFLAQYESAATEVKDASQ